MEKTYNPGPVEERIYSQWLKSGAFLPDAVGISQKTKSIGKKRQKKRFVMMMPPPNVTGNLHIGHALTITIEDALVRYKKIQGMKTLWLPGFDHAGIATQVVVERELKKQGVIRQQLGRERFIENVWKWVRTYKKNIEEQIKKIGALPDWSRVRFTFDQDYQKTVKEAFLRLHKKGLIYRGERIINWCARCQTVLSDLEVEYRQEPAKLYYIKYGPFVLATARPETKLGDTAVAVHPGDARYRRYIGKAIHALSVDGQIRLNVIADEAVDPQFGTGVIKVTPAHDPADFDIGKRHNLEVRKVIGFDNRMNENAGKYAGLSIQEAREKIIKDMQALGLIKKIEDYEHRKAYCSRCATPIEPHVSLQWFVAMKPLAKPLIEAVKKGKIIFVPSRFKRISLHWLENIQDWCISRQLWWGHQLPVYYCKQEVERKTQNEKRKNEGYVIVTKEKPKECPICKKCKMVQDEDVLDTWFSSSLWPFATLGWPKKTKNFEAFYPTDVLETGYDIIFFWVARMLMMGKELTGKLPFHTIYLHGLVRDKQGRKMSKSLGNVVDPLELIEQYGADALRFALLYGNSPGNDMRFDPSHLIGGRNFTNKLWNVARFYLIKSAERKTTTQGPKDIKKDAVDKGFLKQLDQLEKDVKRHMERYQLAQALQKIHNFTWHEFADKYLEHVKRSIGPEKFWILEFGFWTLVRLLHPFMPFVTQAVAQGLSSSKLSKL